MAKVVYSALINSMSGKLNGSVLQNNGTGAIIRGNNFGQKGGSPKVTANRMLQAQYVKAWQALSQLDKAEWEDYAIAYNKVNMYGETRLLSGFNWHESINYNLERFGEAYTDTPPAHELPAAVPPFTFNADSDGLVISFTDPYEATDTGLIIRSTLPMTAYNTTNRRVWRVIQLVQPDTHTEIDITSAWESYFGITWDESMIAQGGQLLVMVQPVSLNSGVSIAGVIARSNGTAVGTGIGYMIIEDTFIVG